MKFKIFKVADYYYYDNLIDYVFILILDIIKQFS